MAVGREAVMAVMKKVPAPRIAKDLRARVESLMQLEFAYMDSQAFRSRSIEATLFSEPLPPLPLVAWYQPTREELGEAMAGSPQLMSAAEEVLMFRRFNFAKRQLKILKKKNLADGLTKERAEQMVVWFERMEHLREYLVRTNLALVLAMAKRTRLGDVDFAEILSEGNMALLRAIEKFNVDRGFKFSTYACRAILKAFSRTAQKHSRYRTRFPVEFDPDYEKSDYVDRKRDNVEDDLVNELKSIVDRNLAELSDVEQTVLRNRFNWQQERPAALTLEEVGEIIGVTKERVRQIQNKALAKIRRIMEDGTNPQSTEDAAVSAF
jgi:RNA polymerase primary sigma factor